jgi:hypothetical protein
MLIQRGIVRRRIGRTSWSTRVTLWLVRSRKAANADRANMARSVPRKAKGTVSGSTQDPIKEAVVKDCSEVTWLP